MIILIKGFEIFVIWFLTPSSNRAKYDCFCDNIFMFVHYNYFNLINWTSISHVFLHLLKLNFVDSISFNISFISCILKSKYTMNIYTIYMHPKALVIKLLSHAVLFYLLMYNIKFFSNTIFGFKYWIIFL